MGFRLIFVWAAVDSNYRPPLLIQVGVATKVTTSEKTSGGLLSIAWALGRPLTISPEAGARTSVYVSSSPDVATVTGAYFVDSRPAAVNPLADDPELASQLWQQLEKLAQSHPTAGGIAPAGRSSAWGRASFWPFCGQQIGPD